jgi:hypothetical protein
VDFARQHASTRYHLFPWFQYLNQVLKTKNYPKQLIVNWDETTVAVTERLVKKVIDLTPEKFPMEI